eukprot:scaffold12952_cov23-Tisochrysis_lutea.AAC.1
MSVGKRSAMPPQTFNKVDVLKRLACFLDAELSRLRKRVQALLTKLPHDINPKGLEELRKVKTALVEAEDRTDTLR